MAAEASCSSSIVDGQLATPIQTFTCFSKLPVELRNIIWEYASNQPRNVDLWAPTIGNMTFEYGQQRHQEELCVFKYYTTCPVPGVLHANQESRTIALQFYQLSFGADFNFGPGSSISISFPAKIYSNDEADRICVMGIWGVDAKWDLWYGKPPASCAVNICDEWESLILAEPDTQKEIFLYYQEGLHPRSTGQIEFVELKEDSVPSDKWARLCDARDTIIEGIKESEHDKQIPKSSPTTFGTLIIKFVAIYVDDVRQ